MCLLVEQEHVPERESLGEKKDTQKARDETNGCPPISYRKDTDEKDQIACNEIFSVIVEKSVDESG